MQNQAKVAAQTPAVALDDPVNVVDLSNGDNLNASVVCTGESQATGEIKKIRQLCKIIYNQKYRIRRLELHVKSLQNIILNVPNEPTSVPEDIAPVEVGTDVDEGAIDGFDLTFNEEWVNNQIAEWRTNGELTQICDDFLAFIDENYQ